MSYPANVATVTVTGTWTYSDGGTTIPTGSVTFQPNTVLQDAGTSQILDIKPLVATLDGTGHITVTLMNTSDVDLAPAGWAYTVTERIAGSQRQYDVFVTGTTVDLSTLAPVSSTPQFGYILSTARGAPNGVASLDSGGQVPLGQLGNAPGGGGTPSGTVVTEIAYGQSSTAGAATPYSRGDHTHGSPSLTANTPTASAVGDTGSVGTGVAPAKDDHRHAREAFGNVTAQTTFAATSANGTAATVSHSDHTHGTPDLAAQYAAFADVSSMGANVTQGTPHLQQRNEPGSVTRLKGQIVLGNTTFTANSVLATLNAGGRPLDPVTFLTRTKVGNVQSLINIATNGQVTNVSSIAATGTDTINFDGWTFDHA